MKSLAALQHTSADYLGLMEDHLEGRRIRFRYFRPFTEQGVFPRMKTVGDGLALLGGGPWGTAGIRNVPTLVEEIELTYECLKLGLPIIGIGLGAQILSLAAGGGTTEAPLSFAVGYAERTSDEALNGYLPPRYPLVEYSATDQSHRRQQKFWLVMKQGRRLYFKQVITPSVLPGTPVRKSVWSKI